MRVEQSYVGLAAAVVAQALKDRRDAVVKLGINGDDRIALGTVAEVDAFLSSPWGRMLSDMGGVDAQAFEEVLG